jgi:beta-xylosidase
MRRGPFIAVALAVLCVVTPARSEAIPAALPMGTYQNPVLPSDFPDPYVLHDRGVFVAVATNSLGPNIQLVTSTNLQTWIAHRDALPDLPDWAVPGRTWAPSIVPTNQGFVLYYTAHHRTGGIPCIGRAFSVTSTGPFVDPSAVPLVCQSGYRGGSIDPSTFVDKYGRPWLIWKSEGTRGIEPTRIWSRPLRFDGMEFDGPAFELLHTDQAWEGPIIENPAMVWAGGKLLLFYSGNRWQGSSYAINWAHCHGPAGPCTKNLGPWVRSAGPVAGPGGQDFFRSMDGKLWMSYHAWDASHVGYRAGGRRSLRIDRVTMVDGTPVLRGPTHTPAPFG